MFARTTVLQTFRKMMYTFRHGAIACIISFKKPKTQSQSPPFCCPSPTALSSAVVSKATSSLHAFTLGCGQKGQAGAAAER